MAAVKKGAAKGQAKLGKPKHESKHLPFAVGPVNTETGSDIQTRMAILLWGPATVGKSTLAATLPGHKLWLSFGDNEHTSIQHRDDVTVANLSGLDYDELFKHAQCDNPFDLDGILRKQEHITSIVCDSATAVTFRALQKAVHKGVGAGKGFTPTMEAPGISAYGGRNAIVLEVLTGILKVTSKYGVHCLITAHEDDPTMRTENVNGRNIEVIDFISVMLGGKLVNNMTWRLSEIWHMRHENTGKERRIVSVRPCYKRKPMKSRMFSAKANPDFVLEYDCEKPDDKQMTLASLYEKWADNGYRKIDVPDNLYKKDK